MNAVIKQQGVQAVLSLIPLSMSESVDDQLKASYLAQIYTGFGCYEALDKIGVDRKVLFNKWRSDSIFLALEDGVKDPITRDEIRREVTKTRLIRNWMLVLEKDEEVIQTALGRKFDDDGDQVPLSKQDLAYLSRMRGTYSNTQMDTLDKVNNTHLNQFNINELIIRMEETHAEGSTISQEVISQ